MNINNLLKTGILACAMVFGINNNVNALVECDVNVNSKVFQHDVTIKNNNIKYVYNAPYKRSYLKNPNTGHLIGINERDEMNPAIFDYDEEYQSYANDHDEYYYPEYNCTVYSHNYNNNQIDINTTNKFNELYNISKGNNNIYEDTITTFENAVRRIFGNKYKVIKNVQYDIDAQYPKNRIRLEKEDGTQKDFIKKRNDDDMFDLDTQFIDRILKENNLELVVVINDYEWEGDKQFYENQLTNYKPHLLFGNGDVMITNGNTVIYYDGFLEQLRIYQKKETNSKLKLNKSSIKDITDKFNALGLILYKKYAKERYNVKKVFGHDFELMYEYIV